MGGTLENLLDSTPCVFYLWDNGMKVKRVRVCSEEFAGLLIGGFKCLSPLVNSTIVHLN